METIASGRIALWEGGSLWVFDVPGAADAPSRTEMHAHHAFQLTFSLGGSFKFDVEDGVVPGPFAIVAPDTLHAFEARGLVSHLFVEPESRAGRTLEQLIQGRPAATMTAAQAQDSPSLILTAFRHPQDPRSALREGAQTEERGEARAGEARERIGEQPAGMREREMRGKERRPGLGVGGAAQDAPDRRQRRRVAATNEEPE